MAKVNDKNSNNRYASGMDNALESNPIENSTIETVVNSNTVESSPIKTISENINEIEQRALRYTLWGNVAIALFGLVFAVWTRSEAIFLDGLFSGIHLIISVVSLSIAKLIQQPGDENFPFGYALFEPFLNFGKGLVIVMVALLAMFSAIEALLGGGRSVEVGIALWYALIAAMGCLFMAAIQHRYAKLSGSQILELDFKNWLIDGAISGAVAIAFALMLFLEGSPWAWLIPYADPVLVLLMVLLVLPLPLQAVIQNGGQIMGRAPDSEQRDRVSTIVASVLKSVPHEDYTIRQTTMGRLVYVQVYLCLSLHQEARYEAGEIDAVRSQLYSQLHQAFPHLAMDLIVTCDRIWVKRAVMPQVG